MTEATKTCSVLSIDAWRNADGGWDWNDWRRVGTVPVAVCDLNPRALLAYMRAEGFLAATSTGRCAVEDDGYNVVIMARGTREPIFAIAYGEVQA